MSFLSPRAPPFQVASITQGIPKEEQPHLFERFVMRGGTPGSGLGLAIAKQIVDLMNGSIQFESDPTVKPGTSCVVLVPLQKCNEDFSSSSSCNSADTGTSVTVSTPKEQSHDGLLEEEFSVLITDDMKMNRMVRRLLTSCVWFPFGCILSHGRRR